MTAAKTYGRVADDCKTREQRQIAIQDWATTAQWSGSRRDRRCWPSDFTLVNPQVPTSDVDQPPGCPHERPLTAAVGAGDHRR
jgi:hypothetical protein